MGKIKNRYKAESIFCQLFVDAGRALGVPPYGEDDGYGVGLDHLSADSVKALHECELEDPHFIGGPGAFNFATSTVQVNRIFERAGPIAAELYDALSKINLGNANKFRAEFDGIKDWMLRNSN